MKTLKEVLADESQFASVAADCAALVDREVASKGGLSGVAIKTGYKVVQGVKPGFVNNAISNLLPDFADALDPLCAEASDQGQGVAQYFGAQSDRVADALLKITDARASRAGNAAVTGAYNKLRGSAKKNVVAALPGLAAIVEKYIR